MRNTLGLWAVLVAVGLCGNGALGKDKAGPPHKSGELFQTDKIWNVHLTFTAEEWAAMEPKGGPGFGGGPGGPGGRPGRGGFGPGMFMAPTFMKADTDKDGKLSADEFAALGENWFAQWDKAKADKLTSDALKAGLDTAFAMPAMPAFRLQGAEGQRNGLAGSMGIEFKFVHADMEFEGEKVKDVGVRYKGNGTWMQSQGQLKRSMKIDLNHFEPGQKFAGVAKLNLHNNVTDASFMNEPLSHKLYRDAGVPAPRTAYARVYVTVPGKHEHQYFGLYSIVEDIDKHFAADHFKEKGGAIFKPVTPTLFADLGDDWAKYKQTYDPKTDLTEAQEKRVIAMAKFVTSADDARFAAEIGNYLDLDEFARFMAVTSWLSTMDSILAMGQNFVVYLDPKTDKFQFLPWDLDHSFGQFGMQGSQEDREQLSIRHPWRGENRFLERVYKVDAFMKVYLERYAELHTKVFVPERFAKQVDLAGKLLRPAVKDESAGMLARFDKVVAGEMVEPQMRGFGGGGFGGPPGGGPGGPPPAQPPQAQPSSAGPPGANTGGPPAPPPPVGQPGAGPGNALGQPGGEPRPNPNAAQAGGGGGGGMRMGGGGGGFRGMSAKPIKGFVTARAKSVGEQLAGTSEGHVMDGGGFGGGGRRGGPGGPGRPGGFSPGTMLQPVFLTAMDTDKDGQLTREEFKAGFAKWFAAWNIDKSEKMSEDELREGLNKDFVPQQPQQPNRGGGGGGAGGFIQRLLRTDGNSGDRGGNRRNERRMRRE